MTDYRSDVRQTARAIAGQISDEQSALLEQLSDGACAYLDSRLRQDVSKFDCAGAYVLAAALYAVSLLRSLSAEKLSAFTAGTLSVSFEQDADSLTRMADRLMAPWFGAPTAFLGVRG